MAQGQAPWMAAFRLQRLILAFDLCSYFPPRFLNFRPGFRASFVCVSAHLHFRVFLVLGEEHFASTMKPLSLVIASTFKIEKFEYVGWEIWISSENPQSETLGLSINRTTNNSHIPRCEKWKKFRVMRIHNQLVAHGCPRGCVSLAAAPTSPILMQARHVSLVTVGHWSTWPTQWSIPIGHVFFLYWFKQLVIEFRLTATSTWLVLLGTVFTLPYICRNSFCSSLFTLYPGGLVCTFLGCRCSDAAFSLQVFCPEPVCWFVNPSLDGLTCFLFHPVLWLWMNPGPLSCHHSSECAFAQSLHCFELAISWHSLSQTVNMANIESLSWTICRFETWWLWEVPCASQEPSPW